MSRPTSVQGVQHVVDAWSYFDYKNAFERGTGAIFGVPSWVPPEDGRRLQAYSLLDSYFKNVSRWWLGSDAPSDIKSERREYGDPNLLVNQTLASMLGVEQGIYVDGYLSPQDEAKKDQEGKAAADPAATENKQATAQYEALEEWANDELFWQKLVESERQSIKLGDSVYVIDIWNEKKQRPRLHVYDPGFYFPVFNPMSNYGAEDFPEKINIVYEFDWIDPKSPQRTKKRYVRRLQWFLDAYDDGRSLDLPWSSEENQEPVTCWYSDGVWEVENMGKDPNLFDESRANWLTDNGAGGHLVDLQIDFIPVIHIPNNVSLQDHYGTALISHVMQLLDDIISNDSDLQRAAAITGTPIIAVNGARLAKDDEGKVLTYGPGTVFEVGDGGATVIDASEGVKALLLLKDALLERLSVNIRIPEALLGRVKPNEVPSGIAITLSFTPHSSLIFEMRLVRKQKYALLLKFISRCLVKHGKLTEIYDACVRFGSFLPADKQETMTLVVQLLASHAISLETAVNMLDESGFPIEDTVLEIERIIRQDLPGNQLFQDITGDPDLTRDRMGLPHLSPEDMDLFNVRSGAVVPVDPNAPDPNAPKPPPGQDPKNPTKVPPKNQ